MDVKRLRLLVELSRRGTIAAVAQAFSYSPSSVSQQLSVLEKETGTRLLEPFGRRVRLTAQGELLVVHAERILVELEHAQSELESARTEVRGVVRLAAFQSAVLGLAPAALQDVADVHPDLRVEVTELEPETSLPALVAGDFDVVLGEEYPGHPRSRVGDVERRDLMRDPLRLAVPEGWAVSSLADAAGRPLAMEPVGSAARDWALAACRDAGFEPDVRCTSSDLQVHLRFVRAGLAAALLPDLAGARGVPGVVVVDLDGAPARRLFTATRRGGSARAATVAVVEALRRAATDSVAAPD